MKCGLNFLLWTTHVTEAHLPKAAYLKSLGYDGVEIPIHHTDPAHYAQLGRQLRELGLGLTASSALPGAAADFLSPQATVRQAASDYVRRVIDSAAALGAECLIGPLYQALGVFTGFGPTAAERARAADALRPLAAHAADAGLAIFLEPLNRFECHLVNTTQSGLELVEEIQHPAMGVMFDTFHANIEEKSPLETIRHYASRIGHVHISENDRGAPGAGHLPLRDSLRAFLENGYDGWFVVEAFGTALPDLAAATRCWRPTFTSENEVCEAGIRLMQSARA